MELLDLIGQKFGRLTVVSKIGVINDSGRIYWSCLCDCGQLSKANTAYLRNGRKASCGCIRKEKSRESIKKIEGWTKKPSGEAAFNVFFHQYKNHSKRKSVIFALTKEVFFEITQKDCFYCLSPPVTPHGSWRVNGTPRNNGPYISNGIDRIDSSQGYTEDNIVPCCRICNLMKHELSLEKFAQHIELLNKNVVNFRSKK